jgi:hypothetical protein
MSTSKKQEEEISDMVSLMKEGFGKSVFTMEDILDTGMNVSHIGGTTAILKAAEGWIEIINTVSRLVATIRLVLERVHPDLDLSKWKTSDLISVEVRYMESDSSAGMRVDINEVATGDSDVDMLVAAIVNGLRTGDSTTVR